MEIRPIGWIETDFDTKFGVPRQSGIIQSLRGRIVFEPEFRTPDALRGLEEFDFIWLIWDFSEAHRSSWSPTVRPPRLGGNERMGVWATRSPFRPNSLGLSSVKLAKIELDSKDGPVLWVEGADLMNGTPIYDIKPYLAYTDSHPQAKAGFTLNKAKTETEKLEVVLPPEIKGIPKAKMQALREVLSVDPRPRYQKDDRVYGFQFGGCEIKFKVKDNTVIVL